MSPQAAAGRRMPLAAARADAHTSVVSCFRARVQICCCSFVQGGKRFGFDAGAGAASRVVVAGSSHSMHTARHGAFRLIHLLARSRHVSTPPLAAAHSFSFLPASTGVDPLSSG